MATNNTNISNNHQSPIIDNDSTESQSETVTTITISPPPELSSNFAPPPYNLNPPSYTTVLRAGETCINQSSYEQTLHHILALLGPSAPFIAPKPPPTYNQAQGLPSEHEFEEFINIPNSESVIFRLAQVAVICPICSNAVMTETHTYTTKLTHLMALIMFLLGCWPCCFLPYCVPHFKTTFHFCPVCGHFFGLYSPFCSRI